METEVPKGWRQVALRSVCEPTRIWNPLREPRDEFWYVDVSAVARESLAIETPQRVKAAQAPSRARKIIQTGDAIFATVRPTLRRIAFVAEKFNNQIASTAFCIVRANRQEAVPHFLYYVLQTEFFNEEIAKFQSGASYPAVNDKDVLNRMIGVPPKPEQEKIASVLLKIQRSMEAEAKLVATARELKQSAMRQLFTHGLRNEPQKETDIGLVPKSWEPKRVNELGEVVTGTTPPTAKREYYDGGNIPFIAPGDLGDDNFIRTTAKKITEAGLEVSRILPKNTVCFVCIGSTIGKVGITVEERSASNQQINAVIANDANDPLYVCYLLSFKSEYVASFSSPSPVPIMSKGIFANITLYVSPDKNEQTEIAGILQTIDRKISVHERKRAALSDLFQTLLHQLMTAQIRVDKLDIDTSEVAALNPQS